MKDIPKAVEDAEQRHQRLTAMDRAHLWHPFTQMQTWLEPLPGDEPVIIDHASGSWLFDTRGRKYLDAISSLWVNVHGHHRAEIDSAIRLQLERVAHTTLLALASPPSIDVAADGRGVRAVPGARAPPGTLPHPPGYRGRTARACKENGVLLICAEVATGFGPTGTLFACEQEEVVPGFLCLAKGLTGGYLPL